MNSDIKSLLIRVCGTISYLIVIFFFVTFILFLHNDVKDALKEAWSVSVSFLSVLATLGAAVIAAYLFNDWRIVQRAAAKAELSKQAITALIRLKSNADKYYSKTTFYANAYEIQYDQNISRDYVNKCINDAKNSQIEKDNYSLELENNLNDFFEKIDLYQTIFNDFVLGEKDREYNFKAYFFHINTFYSCVIRGNEKDISFIKRVTANRKQDFENQYYNTVINALKKNITLDI